MLIDPDGAFNLTRLLLSPGNSVDVIVTSEKNLFSTELVGLLALVDQRLKLRGVLTTEPENNSENSIVKRLEETGWYLRMRQNSRLTDTIIIDSEYAVISLDATLSPSQERLLHHIEGKNEVLPFQQHFDYIWNNSIDLIFENFLYSSVPVIQNQLINISQSYWDRLLTKLSRNPNELYSLDPPEFEKLIADLLEREGFSTQITKATRDGGRDILAFQNSPIGHQLYLVECKRYSKHNPVDVSIVRALYGVVESEKASAGLLVTTSYFTPDALKFRDSVEYRMTLSDYEVLVSWISRLSQ